MDLFLMETGIPTPVAQYHTDTPEEYTDMLKMFRFYDNFHLKSYVLT